MRRRERIEFAGNFEKKHKPVRVTFEAGFRNDAGEVKFARSDVEGEFFGGFAAGAGVRRFAFGGVEFTAGRAPEAEVGLLRAMHEQDFVAGVEAVEESGDFVGKLHLRNDADRLPVQLDQRMRIKSGDDFVQVPGE